MLVPCLQFFMEEWFVSNNIHNFTVCTLTCVTPFQAIFAGTPFWYGNKYAIFLHKHPFFASCIMHFLFFSCCTYIFCQKSHAVPWCYFSWFFFHNATYDLIKRVWIDSGHHWRSGLYVSCSYVFQFIHTYNFDQSLIYTYTVSTSAFSTYSIFVICTC